MGNIEMTNKMPSHANEACVETSNLDCRNHPDIEIERERDGVKGEVNMSSEQPHVKEADIGMYSNSDHSVSTSERNNEICSTQSRTERITDEMEHTTSDNCAALPVSLESKPKPFSVEEMSINPGQLRSEEGQDEKREHITIESDKNQVDNCNKHTALMSQNIDVTAPPAKIMMSAMNEAGTINKDEKLTRTSKKQKVEVGFDTCRVPAKMMTIDNGIADIGNDDEKLTSPTGEKQRLSGDMIDSPGESSAVIDPNGYGGDFDQKKVTSNDNALTETKVATGLSQGNCKEESGSEMGEGDDNLESSFALKPMSSGSEFDVELKLVEPKSNDKPVSYPLDGLWEMCWKSFPARNTTFLVKEHRFKMFDCPCKIKLTVTEGNQYPSFQWPVTITSYETPVFQTTKFAIPLGKTCHPCPSSITWTTSDAQYGEITWMRLHSDGSRVQVMVDNEKDDTSSLYPLDGRWELKWKSSSASSSIVIVDQHKFIIFDCPCKITIGDSDDNYSPSFKWPKAATPTDNPIFCKSKVSIPPGTRKMDLPTIIVWTSTELGYEEITWTKHDCEGNGGELVCNAEDHISNTKRRDLENFRMETSIPGKAWNLVESVLSLQTENILAVAQDDIVYLAERLLRAQEEFRRRKTPHHVDIAYHHTRFENLDTIRTDGLLSCQERMERNINSNFNGSAYGDGIYCSENPMRFAYRRYGETTILLARMKGIESFNYNNNAASSDYDTLVQRDFCVLKRCIQCIPLFLFHQDLLRFDKKKDFLPLLADLQKKVQKLLDNIFNESKSTEADVSWSIPVSWSRPPRVCHFLDFIPSQTVSYVAPEQLVLKTLFSKPVLTTNQLAADCSICSKPLKESGDNGVIVEMRKCGHVFHRKCIGKLLEQRPCCPMCHISINNTCLRGKMPSGSMTISTDFFSCEGFAGHQSIVIDYQIPSGIQKQYHPNPGQKNFPIDTKAYLPDNLEGRKLLKRLKVAFSLGLTFEVGSRNRVDLLIDHRTEQRSDPHGNPNSHPDRLYITRTNEHLDFLQIPPADAI